MKYAILCTSGGEVDCGTDGYLVLDGRNSIASNLEVVRKYREGFKKNFIHKYNFWTHVMFTNRITDKNTPIKLGE